MILGIIVAVVIIIGLMFLSIYNKFVRLRNDVEEAFATMDVYLKKRFDLLPNLVETVKGYAIHEKEVLENIVKARSAVSNATDTEERVNGENQISSTLKTLFAVAEAYPDLKANTNFQELMGQLQVIEADIANSRKYYNAVVKKYNICVETFPSNIVANIFGFTKKPMFEVTDEAERQNVKVDFGSLSQ